MKDSPTIELNDEPEAARHVPIETLRSLSQVRASRVAAAIALNWSVLLLALVAVLWIDRPLAYILGVLVIGNRQYALLLLTHECAHYSFRRRASERSSLAWLTNDRIGNVTCAWPIGLTVQRYRALHFDHHRYLGTDGDPDYGYYLWRMTPWRLTKMIVGGLLGIRALHTALLYYRPSALRRRPSKDSAAPGRSLASLGVVVTHLIIAGAFIACGRWYAYPLLWLLPIFTIAPTLNHLRTTAEHCEQPLPTTRSSAPTTRTHVPNAIERAIFAPVEFCFHHEHHLFPSVPFTDLRELHLLLTATGYYGDRDDLVRTSYLRTLCELCRSDGAERRDA